MSQVERMIICRRCRERIQIEGGSCPHCGTGIRRKRMPIISILLGVILMVAAAFAIRDLLIFFLVGVAMAAIGGYLLWDQRNRIREANAQASEAATGEDAEAA